MLHCNFTVEEVVYLVLHCNCTVEVVVELVLHCNYRSGGGRTSAAL